jgi:hypothetical protein
MSNWEEIQRRNWGASQEAPISSYANLLKDAIAQALATRSDIQMSRIKLTISDAHISISAEISYTPIQVVEAEPARPVQGIVVGKKDG